MTKSNEANTTSPIPHEIEEPPPFGKSWKRLYKLVFYNLVILLILFYIISTSLS